MSWDYYDIKKNKNIEIDATSMRLPKYEKLKGKAMYRLLLKYYTGPDLENELIEMMEKIANR